MNSNILGPAVRLGFAALLVSELSFASPLSAQPSGANVISGVASISRGGNLTTVTAGNDSVLHWDSFNVPVAQTVQFVQPSSSSRVLNWIGGASPSQIDGTIRANGQVYLVNPSGIFFGQTSVVDAGKLFAIGGSYSKEDFLAGLNRFSHLTGAVGNEGTLQGSTVALVGRTVANSGTIVSAAGLVVLAAGDEVLLGEKGGNIYVTALGSTSSAGGSPIANSGVINSGTVDASEGSAIVAAGDVYAMAIVQSGDLRARNVQIAAQGAGEVLVSGKVDATAQPDGRVGGSIQITGERVSLSSRSVLDASGSSGGGTILIGGDAHGANIEVRNATSTAVEKGASILANANVSGNGGKVIVWSDQATSYAGDLSARGAGASGNGGFAEVSGGHLSFQGTTNLGSPFGKVGTLLLDPFDLIISNDPDDSPSRLSWTTLLSSLNSANLTLQTSGNSTENGYITIVESPAIGAYNTPNKLTLNSSSAGGVVVNAPVINAGTGDIELNAGTAGVTLGGSLGAAILQTRGTISLKAGAAGLGMTTFGAGDVSAGHLMVEGGIVAGSGKLIADDIHIGSARPVGTSTAPVTTQTSALFLDSGGADSFVQNNLDSGLSLQAGGHNVSIISRNSVGSAPAPMIVDLNKVSANAGAIFLAASSLRLDGSLEAQTITIDHSGPFTVSGGGFSATGNLITVTATAALNLRGSGDVGTLLSPLFLNTPKLTSDKPAGALFLDNGTSDLALSVTRFSGGGAIKAGNLSLLSPVALEVGLNDLSLTASGNLDLGGVAVTARTLTLAHDGPMSNYGTLSASTLVLGGAGDDGTSASRLVTKVPNLVLSKTGAANVYLDNHLDAGLSLGGSANAVVSINSQSSAGTAPAPLTVTAGGLTAASSLALNSSTLALSGGLTSPTIGLTESSDLSGAGLIRASVSLAFNGAGNVGLASAPLITNTPLLMTNKSAGNLYVDNGTGDLTFTPLALLGEANLRAGNVTLAGPLNLNSNALTVIAGGTLTLGGNSINAGTINFTHTAALTGTGLLTATQLNLNGAGNVGSAASPLPARISTLALNQSGGKTYLDNGTSDLAITPTRVGGGVALHGRNLSLLSALDAGGASIDFTASGLIDLHGNTVTADLLNLWHDGALLNLGKPNVNTLGLGGSGDDGTATTHLVTSVANLQLAKTGTANVYVDNQRDAGLILSGTANAAVAVNSLNNTGSTGANLTIGSGGLATNGTTSVVPFGFAAADATNPSGSVTLTAGNLTLTGGINSYTVTLANSGLASGAGVVSAATQLNLLSTGDVGISASPLSVSTPTVAIDKAAGAVYLDNNGAPLILIPTNFSGGGAFSSGDFTLQGLIKVGSNNFRISTSGSVELGSNDITAATVTFSNGGALLGAGLVTAAQLVLIQNGTVGTVTTPLRFSGFQSNVDQTGRRDSNGVHLGYGGTTGSPLQSDTAVTVFSSQTQEVALLQREEGSIAPESDTSVTARNTKRGGGAAFRAISAKADLTAAARQQLVALGIYARSINRQERLARDRKAAIFQTIPQRQSPHGSDYEVVDARIDPTALHDVLQLAEATGLLDSSNQRLKPVAHALEVSFAAFNAETSTRDAVRFRDWLATRNDVDATTLSDFVKTLRATMTKIASLGLTHQEIEVSQTWIFGNILGPQLNVAPTFLRTLVEGQTQAD